METFISEKDVLIRIKYHKDISQEEKKKYEQSIKGLFMTEKSKEKTFKPIIKNQERNKMKELCPIHNEKLNDNGLCNLCLEQSNK